MPGTETGQTEATKQCKRCGERKPVDKFHNSPPHKHKDLRDSVCAACRAEIYQEKWGDSDERRRQERERYHRDPKRSREKKREYAHRDIEKTREKHRRYLQSLPPEERLAYERARRQTPKGKARIAVRAAVRQGRLHKPDRCEDCGEQFEKRLLHGHHADYDKPLDVEWLCSLCHGKRHRIDSLTKEGD